MQFVNIQRRAIMRANLNHNAVLIISNNSNSSLYYMTFNSECEFNAFKNSNKFEFFNLADCFILSKNNGFYFWNNSELSNYIDMRLSNRQFSNVVKKLGFKLLKRA